MGVKEYFIPYFKGDEEKLSQFAEWAFGPEYENLGLSVLAERWNSRHGDQYFIDVTNKPGKDAPEMVNLWNQKGKII